MVLLRAVRNLKQGPESHMAHLSHATGNCSGHRVGLGRVRDTLDLQAVPTVPR